MGNRLTKLLATSAMIGALAPLSAQAATTIKVMHQGDPQWVAAYKGVAERFHAANPDITVQLVYTPHDAYNEKVGAAVSSNDLPDVMELDAPFLANYVWSGFLSPVKEYVDPKVIEDMTASNVAQGTYPLDNKLYALGLTDSTVMLYASKKRLAAIGARIPTSVEEAWTGEEFEANLEKLSKQPGISWPLDLFRSYGVKTEWITYAFSPILQSMGCDLIDRKTWKASGTLDSDACVKAITMMQNWVKKGWVVPQSAGGNQFYVDGGKVGIAWGGHWFYAEAAAQMKDDLVALPLPKFGTKSVSPDGTWIWAITAKSKHKAEAGKYISFLLQDEGYRKIARENSAFPGLKSFAAASPLYAPGGTLAVAYEQADKIALPRPPHPSYPTITLAFMGAIDAVFNDAPVKAALTKAAKTIDADIEDNDGYPPFGK